jgi:hypothetical protein
MDDPLREAGKKRQQQDEERRVRERDEAKEEKRRAALLEEVAKVFPWTAISIAVRDANLHVGGRLAWHRKTPTSARITATGSSGELTIESDHNEMVAVTGIAIAPMKIADLTSDNIGKIVKRFAAAVLDAQSP